VNCCFESDRQRVSAGLRAQRGFTLLELMVGLTIGLIVVVAAAGSLVHFQSAGRGVGESTRMQQEATAAFQLMGRFIQAAGSIGLTPASTDTVTFADRTVFSGIGTQQLAVQGVDATTFLTAQTAGPDGLTVDCQGAPQTTAGSLITQFDWSNGALRCGRQGANMVPILERVEQMVVHYGIRDAATSQVQYSEFNNTLQWLNLVAIRVCVVLTSAGTLPEFAQVFRDAPSLRYADCRGANIAPAIVADGRLRRTYTQVFTARNGRL
jgi:type IV pilus assembly protein PilW